MIRMGKEEIYEFAKSFGLARGHEFIKCLKCIRRLLSDEKILLWYHREHANETIAKNKCHMRDTHRPLSALEKSKVEGNMVKTMAIVANIILKCGINDYINAMAFEPINYKLTADFIDVRGYYEKNYKDGDKRDI